MHRAVRTKAAEKRRKLLFEAVLWRCQRVGSALARWL